MINVGINGFGRIGRTFLRIACENKNNKFNIVAINARADVETLAHLFVYDSCFGTFKGEVKCVSDDCISINGNEIKITRCNSPKEIPWSNLGVDIVIESTGKFNTKESLMDHILSGAKKVILTSPGKSEDIKTVVMGVNHTQLDMTKHHIISNASCTTNCLAPVAKILDDAFGIVNGFMTTVHSYTNDQNILDKTHKDLRRARAAAESIVPTSTGAAKAVGKVLPNLKGKLNGFSLRVPTPTVSITDLVCVLEKPTSTEELNSLFKQAAEKDYRGILGYCDRPLVSIDFKGDNRSSIVDGLSTMVNGNMVKVAAWYDNEWGYSARVVDLTNYVANAISSPKVSKIA